MLLQACLISLMQPVFHPKARVPKAHFGYKIRFYSFNLCYYAY